MGDLFFIIRMSIYTVIIVLVMQIKIGTQTVEDRVINFTHRSQFSSVIQEFAQGAVTFIGIQYNTVASKVSSQFIKQHSREQRPGQRLKAKLERLKSSIRNRVSDEKMNIENGIEDVTDQIHDSSEKIEDRVNEFKNSSTEYEI